MPPKASNPKLEEYIKKTLAEEPEENTLKPYHSKKEMKILEELGKTRDLVIKKANKGSCHCSSGPLNLCSRLQTMGIGGN